MTELLHNAGIKEEGKYHKDGNEDSLSFINVNECSIAFKKQFRYKTNLLSEKKNPIRTNK